MKKKLVSFLLAFCMLLGMIPSDFVSADASGAVSVEYVFRGAGADKASDKVSATTISNYNLSDSGNWSWYGKTWTAANAEATMRDFGGTDKDYLNVANTQSDEWFALDIKAPESVRRRLLHRPVILLQRGTWPWPSDRIPDRWDDSRQRCSCRTWGR